MATKKKKVTRKKTANKRKSKPAPKNKKSTSEKRWSGNVTGHSDALDLENGVFKKKDPKKIAQSLKRSAKRSKRKKSSPYRSAMSMLTFYINRAGKDLSKKEKKLLEEAKDELRKLFHKKEK